MPIRFQADADLNHIIVSAVLRRVPAIDSELLRQRGWPASPDPEVLARAGGEGRILVTHNQTTMPRHFGEFVRAQRSPGLVVVPQHLALRQAVDDLILIWTATDENEWIDRLAFLPI